MEQQEVGNERIYSPVWQVELPRTGQQFQQVLFAVPPLVTSQQFGTRTTGQREQCSNREERAVRS